MRNLWMPNRKRQATTDEKVDIQHAQEQQERGQALLLDQQSMLNYDWEQGKKHSYRLHLDSTELSE